MLPAVVHPRRTTQRLEPVLMAEPCEGSVLLDVLEPDWRLDGRDSTGEGPPEPEVSGAPGDGVAAIDRPCRPSGHGALARMSHGSSVQIKITREIEDALDRRVHVGQLDGLERRQHQRRPAAAGRRRSMISLDLERGQRRGRRQQDSRVQAYDGRVARRTAGRGIAVSPDAAERASSHAPGRNADRAASLSRGRRR